MNPPHTPYEQVPDRYRDYYRQLDHRSLVNRDNANYDAETSPGCPAASTRLFRHGQWH